MKINFYIPFYFRQPLQEAKCKWRKSASEFQLRHLLEDSYPSLPHPLWVLIHGPVYMWSLYSTDRNSISKWHLNGWSADLEICGYTPTVTYLYSCRRRSEYYQFGGNPCACILVYLGIEAKLKRNLKYRINTCKQPFVCVNNINVFYTHWETDTTCITYIHIWQELGGRRN
jgi:hypothetical protein